jgi:pimeloyl-ACP methyl ester carboxylesterase
MLAAMPPAEGAAAGPQPRLVLDPSAAPAPDPSAEPAGFVVEVDDGTRIHFLDWGGPDREPIGSSRTVAAGSRGLLAPAFLVSGFGWSAWGWAPIARRIHRLTRTIAIDLRGHGLSDAPVEGYDVGTLARDVLAVLDGAGPPAPDAGGRGIRPVLAGHGFGGAVAAAAAALLGDRCGGLVLVDGGWESLSTSSELTPDEFVRALEEPPEVLRSMAAYLADRAAFDPSSWDGDQERAAREAVAELPSGRLVPAIHPHVRDGIVDAMFAYDPVGTLSDVDAPILALVAADDGSGRHRASFRATSEALRRLGRPVVAAVFEEGHNLMRYRPAEVAAAVLGAAETAGSGRLDPADPREDPPMGRR